MEGLIQTGRSFPEEMLEQRRVYIPLLIEGCCYPSYQDVSRFQQSNKVVPIICRLLLNAIVRMLSFSSRPPPDTESKPQS